jgi:hypothetical protein
MNNISSDYLPNKIESYGDSMSLAYSGGYSTQLKDVT